MSEQHKGNFYFPFIFTVFGFAFILCLGYNKNIVMACQAFLFILLENRKWFYKLYKEFLQ